MTQTTPDLAALWATHRAQVFPRGRAEDEYGGHDFMDLVELDTFLAGYISRVASGSKLSTIEASKLNEMTRELKRATESLKGSVGVYFRSLLSLAEAAVASTGGSSARPSRRARGRPQPQE